MSQHLNAQKMSLKDNLAAFDVPKETQQIDKKIKIFLGKDIINIVLNAEKIEAFHLNEWEKDKTATGFHHFKVIEKVANLSAKQRKSLLNIILQENSYVFSDIIKRCEFGPNLGFKFVKVNSSSSLLIALNCDMLRYLYAEKVLKADCDLAHNDFVKLGNNIFPNSFNIKLNPNIDMENTPTNIDTQAVQNDINTQNNCENLPLDIENESTNCEEKEEDKKENCTIFHTVKKGETLGSIAKKYDVNIKNLKAWNKGIKKFKNLKPNTQLKIENQTKHL